MVFYIVYQVTYMSYIIHSYKTYVYIIIDVIIIFCTCGFIIVLYTCTWFDHLQGTSFSPNIFSGGSIACNTLQSFIMLLVVTGIYR